MLNEAAATHRDKKETSLHQIAQISGHFVNHDGQRVVQVNQGSLGQFNGAGTLRLLNHIMEGDKLILVRMQGGHKYVILDRLAEA